MSRCAWPGCRCHLLRLPRKLRRKLEGARPEAAKREADRWLAAREQPTYLIRNR